MQLRELDSKAAAKIKNEASQEKTNVLKKYKLE
jgi:hypothetical protein